MSNVSYQITLIENGIAYIEEAFDLTDQNGPGILTRDGKVVDCHSEGITTAYRRIMMPVQQAKELGIIPSD